MINYAKKSDRINNELFSQRRNNGHKILENAKGRQDPYVTDDNSQQP